MQKIKPESGGSPPAKRRKLNDGQAIVKTELPVANAKPTIQGVIKTEAGTRQHRTEIFKQIRQIWNQHQDEDPQTGTTIQVGDPPYLKDKAVAMDVFVRDLTAPNGQYAQSEVVRVLNKGFKTSAFRLCHVNAAHGQRPFYIVRQREVAKKLKAAGIKSGTLPLKVYETVEDSGERGQSQSRICQVVQRWAEKMHRSNPDFPRIGKQRINKSVLQLEKAKLIKRKKQTTGRTNKRYVCFNHREEQDARLGCFWSTADETNTEFFNLVKNRGLECFRTLAKRRTLTVENVSITILALSLVEITEMLAESDYPGHTAPPKDPKLIQPVLDAMVYEGDIEPLWCSDEMQTARDRIDGVAAVATVTQDTETKVKLEEQSNLMYRLRKHLDGDDGHVSAAERSVPAAAQMPCLTCPDQPRCIYDPNQPINPYDCVHMDRWLDIHCAPTDIEEVRGPGVKFERGSSKQSSTGNWNPFPK